MLTGKIYKNKLSTPEEDYFASTRHLYSAPLARVKSQPGLKQTVHLAPENMESMALQGIVRHQKQLILNDASENTKSQLYN